MSRETARGDEPESDRIALIGSLAGLERLEGPHVDHPHPVVRACTDA
ncbi:hypothetical protein [Streptomyces fodineus]|nr:hypothetical protein [Streptomyces fodineus]